MASKITKDDLRVGDVLFCAGDGWLSESIEILDGGPYSHAALFVGEREGSLQIAEAGRSGVVYFDLQGRIDSEVHTDAYRWSAGDCAELGSADYPVDPILKRAQEYVDAGTKYAYSELVFVAMLVIAKKANVGRMKRLMLAAALDIVNKLIEKGTHPVVCSEFVYRCYFEAGRKYMIEVEQSFLQAQQIPSLEHISEETVNRHLEQEGLDVGHIVEAWTDDSDPTTDVTQALTKARHKLPVIADFVSPNTLSRASNLHLLGRLK